MAQGSKADADSMEINITKTENMHVKRQQAVATPDKAVAKKVCEYKCKNPGCGWIFGNKQGLNVHKGRCEWSDYHEFEAMLDHECDSMPVGLEKTSFLVKWKGCVWA